MARARLQEKMLYPGMYRRQGTEDMASSSSSQSADPWRSQMLQRQRELQRQENERIKTERIQQAKAMQQMVELASLQRRPQQQLLNAAAVRKQAATSSKKDDEIEEIVLDDDVNN